MSLRLRLALALLFVNAIAVGVLAAWMLQRESAAAEERRARSREVMLELGELVEASVRPEDVGDLAGMLRWPLWSEFEDAVILDTRVLDLDGRKVPIGAFLNPRGCRDRPPDFPMQEVTAAVVRASETREPVTAADGVALPLLAYRPFEDRQEAWGGVYVRWGGLAAEPFGLAWRVVLAGVLATAFGAFLVYVVVDATVLRPVLALAQSAERFGRDPGAAVARPSGGAHEVQALSGSMAAMMGRIRDFRAELQREVEAAAARATDAERRAARQERLAAMGMLAAGFAHEINSPLAGALHSLEALRREAAGAGARAERYGQLTEEALGRIRDLVRQLLHLAPQRVERGHCRIEDVVADLRVFLERRLQRHSLAADLPSGGLEVCGARGDLFPVLLNLVQNALDALDEAERAGIVTLRARGREDGGARLTVSDDGPGAPPELMEHLLEPFTTSKDPGAGTGLGLALAQATVHQLGGTLEARNRPEGGFEVVITLPPPPPQA